jgi:hypothetical protein
MFKWFFEGPFNKRYAIEAYLAQIYMRLLTETENLSIASNFLECVEIDENFLNCHS